VCCGKNFSYMHVNLLVMLYNALRHLLASCYVLENRGIHCLDNHVLDLTVDAF
jgi:hypothetical protein